MAGKPLAQPIVGMASTPSGDGYWWWRLTAGSSRSVTPALAKQAVNQALDAQGQWTAIQAAFSLHEVGHAHNMAVHGSPVDPGGAQAIRDGARRA